MKPAKTAIIVPCYNEEKRLDGPRFAEFAKLADIDLVLVDDGSRDRTGEVLRGLAAASSGKIHVVQLEKNQGKGEAVRQGLLAAVARGHSFVGFMDADLATSPEEVLFLILKLASRPDLDVIMASRVLLVGRRVERRATRHYLGRVFAMLAANILRTPIYDTQCGAKVFRVTPMLGAAVGERFVSRWAFDLELLGRLLIGAPDVEAVPVERFREIPLEQWIHAEGSKVTPFGMARTLVDLGVIELDLERRRRLVASVARPASPR